jgi:hypothetical protein
VHSQSDPFQDGKPYIIAPLRKDTSVRFLKHPNGDFLPLCTARTYKSAARVLGEALGRSRRISWIFPFQYSTYFS